MTIMAVQAQRFREFRMPDVGEGLTEAEILKWYVGVGDTVTDGQVVCEVETAKAAVELPIPFDGVVSEIRFDEGTTVDVGTPIIVVDAGARTRRAVTRPERPLPSPRRRSRRRNPSRSRPRSGRRCWSVTGSRRRRRPGGPVSRSRVGRCRGSR